MQPRRNFYSDKLSEGCITSFQQAMDLVADQCDRELMIHRELGGASPELQLDLSSFKNAAQRAAAEYRQRLRQAAEQLAREWLRSGDPNTRLIGEALVTGDYSRLAI